MQSVQQIVPPHSALRRWLLVALPLPGAKPGLAGLGAPWMSPMLRRILLVNALPLALLEQK